jgi:hypothetical protein
LWRIAGSFTVGAVVSREKYADPYGFFEKSAVKPIA